MVSKLVNVFRFILLFYLPGFIVSFLQTFFSEGKQLNQK